MPEVTLQAISEVIRTELEPIKTELNAIKETVSNHTTALVEIAKDVKDLKEQMIVSNRRADKHETAILLTADKVGIASKVQKIIHS